MLCDSGIGHVVHLVVIMIQQLKISSYELARRKKKIYACAMPKIITAVQCVDIKTILTKQWEKYCTKHIIQFLEVQIICINILQEDTKH